MELRDSAYDILRNDRSEKKLTKLVGMSGALHVALIFSFYLLSLTGIHQVEKVKELNWRLAKASVRVDVVKMPKYTIQELKAIKNLEMSAAKVEDEVKAEEQKLAADEEAFIKKKKHVDFLSTIKNLSQKKVAVAKEKAPTKKEKKVTSPEGRSGGIGTAMRGRLDKLVIAGNKLSNGTAIVGNGDGSGVSFSKLDVYAGSLIPLIKPYWKLPSYLINKELSCRIKIFLSTDGELVKTEVYESSGEGEFDERAILAIKSAAPFPTLDPEIEQYGIKGTIVLGFPL